MHYHVIVTDSVKHALTKVRHRAVAAAVVRSSAEIDPLEFTLNAHEIDRSLPVIVICASSDERLVSVLEQQDHVAVVDEGNEELRERLEGSIHSLIG
jgi:hypothetical protein